MNPTRRRLSIAVAAAALAAVSGAHAQSALDDIMKAKEI